MPVSTLQRPPSAAARVPAYRIAARAAIAVAIPVVLSIVGSGAAAASPRAVVEHRPQPISAASAFSLPSTAKCLSGSEVRFELRRLRRVTWVSVTVRVNGKRVKAIPRAETGKFVTLRGLPVGSVALSITAKTSDGRSVTVSRIYATCAAKTVPAPKAPKQTTAPSQPTPPLTSQPSSPVVSQPSQTSSPPPAGSYSGSNGQNGNGLSFYVSADGTQIQDVYDNAVALSCTGSGGALDHLGIDEVTIAPDGSFTSTTTQTGLFGGSTATFTYTFNGHSQGTSFTGTYREDITYNNGTSSCTSNNQSWSATH